MNFNELLKTLEAIDQGKQVDEFLGFGKKKEKPAPEQGKQPQPPGQSGQPATPQDKAAAAASAIGGSVGNAVDAMKKRQQMLKDLEEADKADKDYDGDGEVESEKDEVWGSRMKAAEKDKKVDEEVVDECGIMGGMPPPMETPKQQDSVTMNVSMNGSGAGGIRDLLNVLKDIQNGPSDDMPGDDMDMGPEEPDSANDMLMKKKLDAMGGELSDAFSNSAPGDEGEMMGGVDMMTHDGDDLHKTKAAYPKASGGDNAMKLKDGAKFKLPPGDVKIRLENLYHQIKNR